MDFNRTNRNKNTRLKIGEAIISLMEKTPLSEISVSMVARMARVSRMTFYHYYETKEDALTDYLSEIILAYMDEAKRTGHEVGLRTYDHLVFALGFFSRYDKFMLMMEKNGYYNILISGVNGFLKNNYSESFSGSRYNLYFYAGALLNVFLEWLKGGRVETPEEIAEIIISYNNGR